MSGIDGVVIHASQIKHFELYSMSAVIVVKFVCEVGYRKRTSESAAVNGQVRATAAADIQSVKTLLLPH